MENQFSDPNDLQQAIIQRLNAENEQLKQALAIESANRRQLHNDIYDAKGNIRVIARVRPLTKTEESRQEQPRVVADAATNSICVYEKATNKTIRVPFDKAFGASAEQEDVFQELSPLVNSILDGFNASIFAYGQTGSGKTFTMTGTPQNRGITFRMLDSLFQSAQKRVAEFPGVSYQFQVSVFEIYNEIVRDLLQPEEGAKEIKMDPDSGVKYVAGGVKLDVSSLQQAWAIVERGISNRTVAATDMNANSSRSHLIMMLDVVGHNPNLEASASFTRSRFCAVDLAGSERVAESGVQGLNLKEASQINTSLSVLSRVINSLAQKSKIAPPYRESKLTWLLHDSLSGQSKSVMIVQVSPIESSISQTLQTLQFATRVKAIELSAGGQSKSVDVSRAMATLKKQYEEEIENLKISQLEKEAQLHEETNQLRQQLDTALSQLEMSTNEILQLRAIIQQQQKQNDQLLATVRTMAPVPSGVSFASDSPQLVSMPLEQVRDSPNRSSTVYKGTPLPAKRKSRSPAATESSSAPQMRPFEGATPIKQINLTSTTPGTPAYLPMEQKIQPFQIHEDEDADAILDEFTSNFQENPMDDGSDIDMYFDKENMWKAPASPLVPVRVVSRPTISCLKSCLMNRQATQRPKKRVRWNENELEHFSDEPNAKRAATASAVQNGTTMSSRPQLATPRYQNTLARRPANALPPSSPYRLGTKPKVLSTPVAPVLGAPIRKPIVATPGKPPQKLVARIGTPGGLNKSKLVL